ncbi:tRNA uridine-5-carboxymethylaminomethyl(34) synthesis GTPase MnmE [Sphingomonas oligophenolica]|uniref:tRNA modification GTPase MnmE n=1 Tax=Sphingomonas oligophenolica TaxID=301154 RepID=A0A502CSX2_9SPHN|nr:tRNA uridine-5-carboxymethylaminomethyl(34) synthesis GTPase MnmE [Sphingomonas oligophenolica]TPG15610.1 tRNA uridine-5-carboxymethylaminomethyl(34) synthesis GTPase MnmE [Sphingomonas oligophenolica]
MTTIVAVSSGRPPAAIAVIRISGGEAFAAARALTGSLPPPREARVRALRAADGALLDRALMLVFPGPRSATGEDLVELHCHGGRAVIDAVEAALLATPEVRRAEAGEFTRRALINGRIDLAEAQGLADLLAAETERQRVAAIATAEGRVSRAVRDWMERLSRLAAQVEAMLDFADEDDVTDTGVEALREACALLAADMGAVLDVPPIERLRDGVRVVLAGPPNSGKSTLINLLSDRDVAIVAPIAGTTRDRIEAPVTRNGIPFVLTDTAGLTETDNVIERMGVERTVESIARADILLWLDDQPPPREAIWVLPRADEDDRAALSASGRIVVSREDAESIARLWEAIGERASLLIPRESDLSLDRRQRDACRIAVAALQHGSDDALIIGEQLRSASMALAGILGIDATEAMLDSLFGQFCIGK